MLWLPSFVIQLWLRCAPELGDEGCQFSADGLAVFKDFILGEVDIMNINYSMKKGSRHRNLEEEGAMGIEIASPFMHFFRLSEQRCTKVKCLAQTRELVGFHVNTRITVSWSRISSFYYITLSSGL